MTETELLLEQWKLASELHRHEDGLIWQKFSYFVILTGALFALVTSWIDDIVKSPTRIQIILAGLALTAGFVTSLVFFMILRRGLAFQKRWFREAKDIENNLVKAHDPENKIIKFTVYSKNSIDEWYEGHKDEKRPRGSLFGAQDLMTFLIGAIACILLIAMIVFWFVAFLPNIPAV